MPDPIPGVVVYVSAAAVALLGTLALYLYRKRKGRP